MTQNAKRRAQSEKLTILKPLLFVRYALCSMRYAIMPDHHSSTQQIQPVGQKLMAS